MMHRSVFVLALLAPTVSAAPGPSPFSTVELSCTKLSPERTYHVGQAKRTTSIALEVVTTYRDRDDVNIFSRAVTPDLTIGGRAADESRVTGPATVTWWFYEPAALAVGEPLRYGMRRGPKIDLGVRHAKRCGS